MSDWSSFENEKAYTDKWRSFLSENVPDQSERPNDKFDYMDYEFVRNYMFKKRLKAFDEQKIGTVFKKLLPKFQSLQNSQTIQAAIIDIIKNPSTINNNKDKILSALSPSKSPESPSSQKQPVQKFTLTTKQTSGLPELDIFGHEEKFKNSLFRASTAVDEAKGKNKRKRKLSNLLDRGKQTNIKLSYNRSTDFFDAILIDLKDSINNVVPILPYNIKRRSGGKEAIKQDVVVPSTYLKIGDKIYPVERLQNNQLKFITKTVDIFKKIERQKMQEQQSQPNSMTNQELRTFLTSLFYIQIDQQQEIIQHLRHMQKEEIDITQKIDISKLKNQFKNQPVQEGFFDSIKKGVTKVGSAVGDLAQQGIFKLAGLGDFSDKEKEEIRQRFNKNARTVIATFLVNELYKEGR